MFEFKQEVIPLSLLEDVSFVGDPDRIEFINEQSENGWEFVSSFVHRLWGRDNRRDGWPTSQARTREVMTFKRMKK